MKSKKPEDAVNEKRDETKSTEGPEPLLRFEKDLYEHARARALAGGAAEIREEDLAPVVDHARAMAKQLCRDRFNPKKHPNDALRAQEHDRVLAERADVQTKIDYADAALREAEQKLASIPAPGAEPRVHDLHFATATGAIAISIAPVVHDLMLDLADPILLWLLAVVAGLAVALTVAWPIARTLNETGERSRVALGGLAWGIIVGAGVLVVRLAAAESFRECAVACGLTLLELGAVGGLELAASHLRPMYRNWSARKDPHDSGTRERDAARELVERLRRRLADLASAVNKYVAYVEERSLRNRTAKQVEAAAVGAARDGFAAGITENKARLLGATRRAS
jgi:hypothetical protein